MKRQYQNISNKSLVLPSPHGGTVVINRGATVLLGDYYDRFVPHLLVITSMNAVERPRVMLKSQKGAVARNTRQIETSDVSKVKEPVNVLDVKSKEQQLDEIATAPPPIETTTEPIEGEVEKKKKRRKKDK